MSGMVLSKDDMVTGACSPIYGPHPIVFGIPQYAPQSLLRFNVQSFAAGREI
jgi:hypothetical protein